MVPVLVPVDEVDDEVADDEDDVPDVDQQDVVDVSGVYLCADSGDVADDDEDGEHQAHALCSAGADIFDEGYGP